MFIAEFFYQNKKYKIIKILRNRLPLTFIFSNNKNIKFEANGKLALNIFYYITLSADMG